MTKYEKMNSITNENGGYLLSDAVRDAGISREYLSVYVKDKEMERVETGVYILPDIFPDPLYILQHRNKEMVYSHETALYLHGLTEREPSQIYVSVKRGYNASHLIRRGVKPYYVKTELFDCGVVTVRTLYGNEVKAYDIDRTICDVVRRKDEMDIQVFQKAIKEYMSGNKKDIHKLMYYANKLGIEEKIRFYTEVLL